jgi:hypothetical protein
MTQQPDRDALPDVRPDSRPDARADSEARTLVEREGVNAGSDRATVEGDVGTNPHPLASESEDTGGDGGHPLHPLDGDDEAARLVEEGRAPDPLGYPSESGQDNGSIS